MDEPTVAVGRITKAHGLRGEVSVENRSDNPDRFTAGARVLMEDGRSLTVAGSHPHGSRLLVTFEGVTDRAVAESLRGRLLVVPQSWLPELPDGEYWPFQLEGCEIVTEAGRSLGVLDDVVPNPAHDLWVAKDDAGAETIVPAIHEVIVQVDVGSKRILVRDIPGLTAPEAG